MRSRCLPRPILFRNPLVLMLLAAAGCSSQAREAEPRAAATGALTGLYERAGVPDQPSRICIAGEGSKTRFGLNASYEGPESCTARGRMRSAGSALTFAIDGDPACRLTGTKTATGLVLNQPEGPECEYYCGRNTTLDSGPFEKVGSTERDAGRVVDIGGDPLC